MTPIRKKVIKLARKILEENKAPNMNGEVSTLAVMLCFKRGESIEWIANHFNLRPSQVEVKIRGYVVGCSKSS